MGLVRYTMDADMAKLVDGFLKVVEVQKKTEKQFERTTKAARKQEKDIVSGFTNIHKSFLKIVATVGGLYAVKRTFTAMIKGGFDFNKTLESSRLGIASLVSASYDLVDTDGKRLQGLNKIIRAQEGAKDLQDDIRIAGLKTTATYEQLIEAFQQGFAPGTAVGLGLEQIQKLTVQITQAAGAIGVPMNQLAEEIRSIFQGTITPRNTRIATALGITNEDIRRWTEAGTLFEELSKQFSAFSDAGTLAEQTWSGLSSNLIDALQQLLGKGFEPLFEFAKSEARDFLNYLVKIEDGVIELNPELVALGNRSSEALMDIYKLGEKIAWAFSQAAQAVDLTYQTIGSWKQIKTDYEEANTAIQNIIDMAMGRRDWRTGAWYGKTSRFPIPPRPEKKIELVGMPVSTQDEAERKKILKTVGLWGSDLERSPDYRLGKISEDEYAYLFGGGQAQIKGRGVRHFGEEPEDRLKRQLEERMNMIDAHHTDMLEKAITYQNADQAIKDANAMADRERLNAQMEYEKAIWDIRVDYLNYYTGATAANFKYLAENAGKHNKAMFTAYKAFAITETIIQTYKGAQEAFTALAGIPIVGPALGAVAAAAAIAAGMMRVAMIRKEKPPGYAMGGIATGPEYGYPVTLHGSEAVVPLPDGRTIPVQIAGGTGNFTVVNVEVAGDVYDQNTMARLVAVVSENVSRAVLPRAFSEAYRYNHGGVRDMVRGT